MEKQQSNPQGLDTFEHVVVLMLENRSFDNLLGYLYEDGVPQGKSFAGLQNSSCANPVPERANGYKKGLEIEPHEAADYHQPFPDPGEGYQHVNTQLYNFINPDNVGVDAAAMKPPYNIPENAPVPPMNGFVNDYVNTLAGMKDANYKDPDYSQYSVIMQCFKPAQVPVLTTLAREFAVFDHWHCAVPSQTWCNRAFWHAATSGGKVTNPLGEGGGALGTIGDVVSWAKDVWSQDNIFQRMKDKGVSYSIYAADFVSLTLMVNGTKVIGGLTSDDIKPGGLAAYKNAISEGTLAQYSFIEPWYMGQHNDQHPSAVSGAFDGPTRVGSVLLGEKLIWDVYTSLKNSDKYRDNTLLIITYDEHGGCFDHIVPPAAVPPVAGMVGQDGFTFDRLGIRVPMVMISPYLHKNTIINEDFDHTSFIKTMCDKWGMAGLTDRDAAAKSFAGVFSSQKRSDPYPDIPEPVIPSGCDADYHQDPLNELQKSILIGLTHLVQSKAAEELVAGVAEVANDVAKVKAEAVKTVGDAIKYIDSIKHLF